MKVSESILLNELDEKLHFDWNELIQRYVNESLKRIWNTYYINCPFHWENTPSFWISFQKKKMKCFWCWRFYSNILKFLCDYLLCSPQVLINKLIEDWFITDINVLWDNLTKFLEFDIKKNIYQRLENKFNDKEKIFKRILYYWWWLWRITDEKIETIEDFVWKKYKKDKEQTKIAWELLDMIKENKWKYWLMFNEYNNISFYSWDKGSKATKTKDETYNILYAYNDSVDKKINDFQQEKTILSMLLQNWDKSTVEDWLTTKIKSILESKTYTKYLENAYKFDVKEYWRILTSMFIFKDKNIQFNIWEWFFDVYSLWIFWLPYFTWWTWIWEKKIYHFIDNVFKRSKIWWFNCDINLFFDNDKAWTLWTVKFLNQWLKYNNKRISVNNNIAIKVFDFETFKLWIKQLYSIVSHVAQKNPEDIKEEFDNLIAINRWVVFDSMLKYDIWDSWLFSAFKDVNNDWTIIKNIKKIFWWNYDESDKSNWKIKDAWEIPAIVNYLILLLLKIKEKYNEKEYLIFRECVIWEFKSLFNWRCFKSLVEYKEIINNKINTWELSRLDIQNTIPEDYLFWWWKQEKKQFENCLKNEIDKFYREIDVELESLNTLNYLCYVDELKEQAITTNDQLRSMKAFIKKWIEEYWPRLLVQYNKEILENTIKLKNSEEAENTENEVIINKCLLIINLWKELWIWNDITELFKMLLLNKEFWLKCEERKANDILAWKTEFLDTPEIKLLYRLFDHYWQINDMLKNKIISEIQTHWKQENLLDINIFEYAFSFLIKNYQEMNIKKEKDKKKEEENKENDNIEKDS